ncbi:hypothetical protein Emag_007176 [Eimeria magna]
MARAAGLWATAIARRGSSQGVKPSWMEICESRIFPVLRRVHPCLPLYTETLKCMKAEDFKPQGLIVNPQAQAKLGEFYLCCAYTLKPEEVDAAEGDRNKLLKLARQTAEEVVEPWIAAVRAFVEDYDPSVAQKLEEAAALKASAETTFWRLNFEAASPQRFARFLEEVSRHQAALYIHLNQPRSFAAAAAAAISEEPTEDAAGGDAIPTSLRPLADEVYSEWLAATAQPIKGEVRAALASCGLLVIMEEAARRAPHNN